MLSWREVIAPGPLGAMREPVRFLLNDQRIDTAGVAMRGKHPGSIAIAAETLAVRQTAARQSTPHPGVAALHGQGQ